MSDQNIPVNIPSPPGSSPAHGSTLWVWEIVKLVQHQEDQTKKIKLTEYVTARSIEWVWDYLAFDLLDESVEIESIHRAAPIVAVLEAPNDQAQAQPPTATPERKGDNQ